MNKEQLRTALAELLWVPVDEVLEQRLHIEECSIPYSEHACAYQLWAGDAPITPIASHSRQVVLQAALETLRPSVYAGGVATRQAAQRYFNNEDAGTFTLTSLRTKVQFKYHKQHTGVVVVEMTPTCHWRVYDLVAQCKLAGQSFYAGWNRKIDLARDGFAWFMQQALHDNRKFAQVRLDILR